jgi:hypothetical protein
MRYRLEVMDRYQQFHPLSQLCGVQSGQMDCEVPMETFEDAPFFLTEGTPILVRASAFAGNQWGSPSSVDYNGARVIGAPGRMSQVRASNVSDSAVTLTWDAVDGMGANDKYEIYFSQTGGLGDYIYWTSVSGNTFEVQNLYPSAKYYFRVRGKNPCGVCAFSEPLPPNMSSPLFPTLFNLLRFRPRPTVMSKSCGTDPPIATQPPPTTASPSRLPAEAWSSSTNAEAPDAPKSAPSP